MPAPRVTLAQLSPEARLRVHLRAAVLHARSLASGERPVSLAWAQLRCVRDFRHLLNISSRSLQRWEFAYEQFGLAGLVEQRLGRSGRKPLRFPAHDARRKRDA